MTDFVIKKKRFGRRTAKDTFFLVVKLLILSGFAATTLVPFLWVLFSSFKTNSEIFGRPFALPKEYSLAAFKQAWVGGNIGLCMTNSVFYSVISIFLILMMSAMVSYSLAKLRPSKRLYAYFSFGLLVPLHAIIIPLNIVFSKMGINNTRFALILAYVVSNLSMSIFILTASMRTMPDELLQAAQIDGCRGEQVFFMIALPISKAALATAGTLAFVNCWNDFLLSLTITSTADIRTLNLAVYNLRSSFTEDYSVLTAGITIMVIPAVLIYSLFQEQIIKGMTTGAIKG